MPNHVTNILVVSGDADQKQAMFEAIKSDEHGLGSIDFNKVIPIPESLKVECGSRTDRAMKLYREFFAESASLALTNVANPDVAAKAGTTHDTRIAELVKKYEALTKDDPGLLKLGEQCYENMQHYGCSTWYDWSIANWGTKWNSYGYGYSGLAIKDFDGSTINFQTAWSYPDPIIAALAERYPDLHFEVKWADEDFGFNVGHKEFEDGGEIFCHKPEGGSKEALELAAEVRGIDLADEGYLYNKTTGQYEYHDPEEAPMSMQLQ